MSNIPFVGLGHNPQGPDLPTGFGMQLAQDPQAMECFGKLSRGEKRQVVDYIRGATTGDDARKRIYDSVAFLHQSDLSRFQ